VYRAVLDKNPDDAWVWVSLGTALQTSGQTDAAIAAHQRAAKYEPTRAQALYNLACAYATTGRKGEALTALEGAAAAGFAPIARAANDPDFASVRDDARFKKLVSGS
jgi:Flp pilus assembly protein TadD